MDAIVGFITDLTGEKRGPSKYYRHFNVLTLDNEPIEGWVFSTIEIDQTVSGNILAKAVSDNTSVRNASKTFNGYK